MDAASLTWTEPSVQQDFDQQFEQQWIEQQQHQQQQAQQQWQTQQDPSWIQQQQQPWEQQQWQPHTQDQPYMQSQEQPPQPLQPADSYPPPPAQQWYGAEAAQQQHQHIPMPLPPHPAAAASSTYPTRAYPPPPQWNDPMSPISPIIPSAAAAEPQSTPIKSHDAAPLHHRRTASPATALLCNKLTHALSDRPSIHALLRQNILRSDPSDAAAVERNVGRLTHALAGEKAARAAVRAELKAKLRARPSLDMLIRQHVWPQFEEYPGQALELTLASSPAFAQGHARTRSALETGDDSTNTQASFAQRLASIDESTPRADTVSAGGTVSSPSHAAAVSGDQASVTAVAAAPGDSTSYSPRSRQRLHLLRASFLDAVLTRFQAAQQHPSPGQRMAAPTLVSPSNTGDLQSLVAQVRAITRPAS